jgi:4-alpha-glucanotransferase
VGATLEDATGVTARPNLPGTMMPARDNWSTALPVDIGALRSDRFVAHLAEALRR